jgi:rubrerythrin
VTHFDPSWCARINAHKRREPKPEAAAQPPLTSHSSQPEQPSSPTPFRLREIPKEHVCERCGAVMYDHHCKIVCPNCGYKRDCSDP